MNKQIVIYGRCLIILPKTESFQVIRILLLK